VSYGQFEASLACADRQIVIVEERQPELFIKPPVGIVHLPFHEQAKPRQLGHGKPLPTALLAPSPRKHVHLIQIAISHALDQLRRRRIIAHRPNQADIPCNKPSRPLSPPC